MTTSLLTKGAIGILGLGTVATGSVYFGRDFVYKKSNKTTPIRELIRSVNPHKRLISVSSEGDSKEWKDAWKAYRDEYRGKSTNPFSLASERVQDTSPEVNAPVEFMNKCSYLSGGSVSDSKDELYEMVVGYCTRDALISDLISEKNPNRVLLSETGDDVGRWKASWKAYQDANKEKTQGSDKWALSNWGSNHGDVDAPQLFKKECKKRSEVKTKMASSDDYLNVLNWCTKIV